MGHHVKLTPTTPDYRQHDNTKVYKAHISGYELRDGDYGQYILWTLDGKKLEDDVAFVTSAALTPRAKLTKLYKTCYPTWDGETEIDLDTLIGISVKVMFDHEEQEDGGWKERAKIIGKGGADPKDYPDDTAPF